MLYLCYTIRSFKEPYQIMFAICTNTIREGPHAAFTGQRDAGLWGLLSDRMYWMKLHHNSYCKFIYTLSSTMPVKAGFR